MHHGARPMWPRERRRDEPTAAHASAARPRPRCRPSPYTPLTPAHPPPPPLPGVCTELLTQLPRVPVLGVCLGHQALAAAHGARVARAPEPVHGRLSALAHGGHPLFDGCPSGPGAGFDVVRWGRGGDRGEAGGTGLPGGA